MCITHIFPKQDIFMLQYMKIQVCDGVFRFTYRSPGKHASSIVLFFLHEYFFCSYCRMKWLLLWLLLHVCVCVCVCIISIRGILFYIFSLHFFTLFCHTYTFIIVSIYETCIFIKFYAFNVVVLDTKSRNVCDIHGRQYKILNSLIFWKSSEFHFCPVFHIVCERPFPFFSIFIVATNSKMMINH